MEMRRFILICLLVLGPGLAALAGEGRLLLRFDKPEQSVEPVRFDAGVRTLRYTFENVSDKTVFILEVHSTCGCFTGETAKKRFAPGELGEIVATLDPRSLHGEQKRHLTIVTSDGDETVLNSLEVSVNVLRDETEGQIRYAEDLGMGLRTDTVGNRLLKDGFGDYVFSIPLYNDTDETVRIECRGSWRMILHCPVELAPRSRADLRGSYFPHFRRPGDVDEVLEVKVNGETVTPLHVRGTLLLDKQ